MTTYINNTDDLIDSRDVIERIAELTEEREALETPLDRTDWGTENAEELAALTALADEASNYAADWEHGEALIRDSYFQEYAQELAEDIGAVNADATWPNNCIDWEQAARELRMDYAIVSFAGVDYWIR